jgi:hypothetical protein
MIDVISEQLNDFGQLYHRYQAKEPIAQQILQGQHRYLINLTFDPLTGEALPQRMSHWLSHDTQGPEKAKLYDRFSYLMDHCADAIYSILIMPRQTIIRVHEMTPVYLAQRLDSRSVQWLSRKPGNNLREKLAANPHILAATRRMSFDTLENRLLKAFLIRTQGLILDRQDAGLRLTEGQEVLIGSIQKALRDEEFVAIGPWQHLPPNNVLLQDKQYRKVWRAWQLVNRLEDDCEQQQRDGVSSGFSVFGELLKQLTTIERYLLLDQDWQFKLDYLSVNSSSENTEDLVPFEVLAIDFGKDKKTGEAKIIPSAELLLSLSVEGNIRIQRRVPSGQTEHWQLDFRQSYGLIEVKQSSNINGCDQSAPWQTAMPEDFLSLAKQLVSELLSGDCTLRQQDELLAKTSDDFVSLMFDGVRCKFQTSEETGFTEPKLLNAAGLDCSKSQAISADENVFSAIELTQVIGDSHTRRLGGFAELLASKVRATLGMHYLVSDHHSEFETNDLRREMNRNFSHAAPLPKSIAAVYATLEKQQFEHNDLIMVLSSDINGVYATPVYYCLGEKLGEEYLERHPSIRLSEQGEQQLLLKALVGSGLPDGIAERFIELYSYREIASNKAPLILHDGEHWYRVPIGLKVGSVDVSDALLKEASALQKSAKKRWFLSVSTAVKQQKGVQPMQWLASDPLTGSQRLLQRQYTEPHKVFWKDHLPQLMTRLPVEGIERDFYFVDTQTSVKPERGIAIDIPIETFFILPSGKEKIPFPVCQGKGSHYQKISLLLSLRQPLKTECVCKLTLTYTYGDEQPYKLRFTPVSTDNMSFNYVDAQWCKKQDDIDSRAVAIPAFPERLTFEKLRAYPGSQGPRDIIEWVERNLKELSDIYNFIFFDYNDQRFNFNYKNIVWISNRNFGYYYLHPSYESIKVYLGDFNEFDVANEKCFSGGLRTNRNNEFVLTNVGPQGELDLEGLTKRWRFPMLIFSDQDRGFVDEDIPKDFAQKGNQAIKQAQELLELEGIDKTLEIELKMFLSYCHKLMPKPAVDELLLASSDKLVLRREHNRFKYAFGDASQPWQQQLLAQILNSADDSRGTRAVTLEISSVAMWRDKAVVHQLTAEQVITLAKRLNEHLLDEIKRLKKEDNFIKWNSFILCLELLLALLRTRESSVSEISSLFILDSNLNRQLLSTVEKITDQQAEALVHQLQHPKVVARVKLTVDKPAGYHRTPDLLYALKLYLSGDDGADQIMITELVNNA